MEPCDCGSVQTTHATAVLLECVECAGGTVRCPRCGKPAWWPVEERTNALYAAEAHRWETGHARVVVQPRGGAARATAESLRDH